MTFIFVIVCLVILYMIFKPKKHNSGLMPPLDYSGRERHSPVIEPVEPEVSDAYIHRESTPGVPRSRRVEGSQTNPPGDNRFGRDI